MRGACLAVSLFKLILLPKSQITTGTNTKLFIVRTRSVNSRFKHLMEETPVLKSFVGLHDKCRNGLYPRSGTEVKRLPVPEDKIAWAVQWNDYTPPEYTDPKMIGAVFADPQDTDPGFAPVWNAVDGKTDRRSFISIYEVAGDRPQNPMGRTGLTGRGCLGKWGPNHAADPIVTRWKQVSSGCCSSGIAKHPESGMPILQFVAVLRRDCRQWAIPGGMVDAGERVSATMRREFGEEALNTLEVSDKRKKELERSIHDLFSAGKLIYRGYVDDPRNTDNSWMETVAINFHDEAGDSVGQLNLQAGDDAVGVQWMDLGRDMQLYASHTQFLQAVAKLRSAHW